MKRKMMTMRMTTMTMTKKILKKMSMNYTRSMTCNICRPIMLMPNKILGKKPAKFHWVQDLKSRESSHLNSHHPSHPTRFTLQISQRQISSKTKMKANNKISQSKIWMKCQRTMPKIALKPNYNNAARMSKQPNVRDFQPLSRKSWCSSSSSNNIVSSNNRRNKKRTKIRIRNKKNRLKRPRTNNSNTP